MADLAQLLRAHGKRVTPQRRRILDALARLEHGTTEAVAAEVAADGGPPLPLSTIYRGLDALEELGVVGHTHLDHRSPAYHLAGHADHIHLVCLDCGQIGDVPVSAARSFVGNVRELSGFDADMTHMAVHGHCRRCRPR